MFTLSDEQKTGLKDICARFQVRRLDLFGSGATHEFDPSRSDLDFLVTFIPEAWEGAADRYFGMKDALEALFQRPVDLVEERAIRRPWFKQRVNHARKLLYAA